MPRQSKLKPARGAASDRVAVTSPKHAWLYGRPGRLLGVGAILAATVLAYLPVLSNGFIWDDDEYVTENYNLRSWPGLVATWTKPSASPQYYPLVFTSFWVEYHLWELNPLGYHLVNVLLHASSAAVLFLLLRRLAVPGALLAGLVFAIHPVHVESVAWITERKNVLSGLMYLLAVAAYLRFDRLDGGRRQWRFYAATIVLFTAALLSKTVTCTLPAVLVLLVWWKRPKMTLRDLWPLVPLLLIGMAMGLVTVVLERTHVRAEGADWDFSIPQRLLIAGQALWFYASKLIYPHPLMFIYPRWTIQQVAWWQYLFPAAAVAAMVTMLLLRRRVGKGPAVAVLFFAGTLLPALGFFNVYPMRFSFVADHFQYLASVGLIALICATLWRVGVRLGSIGRRVGIVLAVAAAAALGAATWQQTKVYRNAETVWQNVLTRNFDCWVAHTNLGSIYAKAGNRAEAAGDPSAARDAFEKCTYYNYHAARIRSDYAESLYILGSSYARIGKDTEAVEQFRKALETPTVFHIPDAQAAIHTGLGTSLTRLGKMDEGIAHYREAIRQAPKRTDTYNNLGVALMNRGQLDEAVDLYRQAIAIDPRFFQAYHNLGIALDTTGDVDGAIKAFSAAVAIRPNSGDTHRFLAFALARRGMVQEAVAEFNRSVQLLGPNPQIAAAFAQVLKQTAGVEVHTQPK